MKRRIPDGRGGVKIELFLVSRILNCIQEVEETIPQPGGPRTLTV